MVARIVESMRKCVSRRLNAVGDYRNWDKHFLCPGQLRFWPLMKPIGFKIGATKPGIEKVCVRAPVKKKKSKS
jgi:hypothetical protein